MEAVDVNFIGCIEKPPLIYAVQMKSLSIAKLLIEYGSKSYLWNLNLLDTLKILTDNGLDINEKDHNNDITLNELIFLNV
ncbi:hypothetical protein U3516DRAFT_744698 [Neocallimastix sp. 'constans']